MVIIKGTGNLQDELNRMNPAAAHVKLGDVLNDIITQHNALLVKLDADAGVSATDHAATLKIKTLSER